MTFIIILVIIVLSLIVCYSIDNSGILRKTKWYNVDKIEKSYYDIPGVSPCTKCGQEKCNLIMIFDMKRIGIHKKDVSGIYNTTPYFYVECPRCGCRSQESNSLKAVIETWNMDSRFQLEEK